MIRIWKFLFSLCTSGVLSELKSEIIFTVPLNLHHYTYGKDSIMGEINNVVPFRFWIIQKENAHMHETWNRANPTKVAILSYLILKDFWPIWLSCVFLAKNRLHKTMVIVYATSSFFFNFVGSAFNFVMFEEF
jgi:hypothetical protein